MGKSLKLCAAVLVSMLAFGCASNQSGNSAGEETKAEYIRNSYKAASVPENDPHTGKQLVAKAHKAIGTPYVLGGTTLGGFDCSGFVKWAYSNIGVTLPRTAREQSVVGEKIRNVEDMRAGDIVAFRHPRRGYHTGIYVGDGKFIHSPRKRTRVRINSLSDPYFSQTLLGARRVNMAAAENLVAQSRERLDNYIAERTNLSVATKNVKARKARQVHQELASKSRKTAKSVAANSKAHAKKTSAAKSKKTGKSVAANSAKKAQKSEKSARSAKLAKTAGKSAKTAKATATVASSKAKNTSRKSDSKAVSMLGKKQAKPSGRRNHS